MPGHTSTGLCCCSFQAKNGSILVFLMRSAVSKLPLEKQDILLAVIWAGYVMLRKASKLKKKKNQTTISKLNIIFIFLSDFFFLGHFLMKPVSDYYVNLEKKNV